MTDTDAKRIARITAQHEAESASHDDVSWLLSVIAERDERIAELERPIYLTIMGQDWEIIPGKIVQRTRG